MTLEQSTYNPNSIGQRFLAYSPMDWLDDLPFHQQLVLIPELRDCESWSQLSPLAQGLLQQSNPTLAYALQNEASTIAKGGPGSGRHPENPHSELISPSEGDISRLTDRFTAANKAAAKLINQGQTDDEMEDKTIRGKQKAAIAKDIAARLFAKYGKKFDRKLARIASRSTVDPDATPEQKTRIREEAVAILITRWAVTSNDTDPKSLAMQEAAQDEFGLKGTAGWNQTDLSNDTRAKTDDDYAKNGDLYRAFLRAQYESTQEYLAKNGVKELGLYRGVKGITPEQATQLRPLSAWSYSLSEAQNFAWGGGAGLLLAAMVPADRVLSCARTGIGCLNEKEVVVLGNGDGEKITTAERFLERNGETYAVGPNSDLQGADFRNAFLWGVNLSGANLAGANLSNADLQNANLTGANLTGAKLTGCWGDEYTILPPTHKVVGGFVVPA